MLDMNLLKKSLTAVTLSLTVVTAVADYPAGYYDRLEGLCGIALRKAAKQIVASHTVVDYGADTWSAFEKTDTHMVNGKLVWWDMYSDSEIPVSAGRPNSTVMNIEHSVANSWWGKTKNDAYKDLFHLNPSDSKANSAKGNFPLGEISGTPTYDNGVTFVGPPKSGMGGGCSKVYEPADVYKGDFARVFFYMFTVYDNISWKSFSGSGSGVGTMYSVSGGEAELSTWAYEMMLRWAADDQVSEKETDRNDAIYGIQHNRNPFIDLPTLARHIWGDLKDKPFHLSEVVEPGTEPGEDPDDNPVDPSAPLIDCDWDSYSKIADYEKLGWKNVVTDGDFSGWLIKTFSGNNYISASAYSGKNSGPFVAYLVSPAVRIPTDGETLLTFRTQGAYGSDNCTLTTFITSGPDFAEEDLIQVDSAICTPPASGSNPTYCDWLPSGECDLSDYPGERRVVWRYESKVSGSGAATYCVDDVKLTTYGQEVSVWSYPENPDVMLLPGAISTESEATVFDVSGRCVGRGSGVINLSKGIYVVVTGNGVRKVAINK